MHFDYTIEKRDHINLFIGTLKYMTCNKSNCYIKQCVWLQAGRELRESVISDEVSQMKGAVCNYTFETGDQRSQAKKHESVTTEHIF